MVVHLRRIQMTIHAEDTLPTSAERAADADRRLEVDLSETRHFRMLPSGVDRQSLPVGRSRAAETDRAEMGEAELPRSTARKEALLTARGIEVESVAEYV